MTKSLIFILILFGLTASFKKVADWFQNTKNINIIPASLIEMVAIIIFIFTYGSTYTNEVIWMWLSIAIILVIIILNLIKYGLKNGALASIAELAFCISAAFLLACILITRSQKSNDKRHRKK